MRVKEDTVVKKRLILFFVGYTVKTW